MHRFPLLYVQTGCSLAVLRGPILECQLSSSRYSSLVILFCSQDSSADGKTSSSFVRNPAKIEIS